MSVSPTSAPKNFWARVGIIYSEKDGLSLESKHIAFYLAAQLTSKGYCEVIFICHRSDGYVCLKMNKYTSCLL